LCTVGKSGQSGPVLSSNPYSHVCQGVMFKLLCTVGKSGQSDPVLSSNPYSHVCQGVGFKLLCIMCCYCNISLQCLHVYLLAYILVEK